ncbi:MAG: hypothetical protein WCA93_10005 [Acidimicrobiia bacterium]
MVRPSEFSYDVWKSGDVVIKRLGTVLTVLRHEKAKRFLDRVQSEDEQELMARLTGNYKRGNERRG